ncbi:MAG: hypothetical protein IJN34_01170 [Clostridia bacterium]|nr:hypothetical protein [Clostridia bacterium]
MDIFAHFFLIGAGLSAKKMNKNLSKSPRVEVEDFKKSGFLFHQGTKRSQCRRIGEYFNKDGAKIRLFKTRSGYILLP